MEQQPALQQDTDNFALLARAFAAVLKEWLTDDQMATVNHRNNSGCYSEDICASHDFCDANMAMCEAFEQVFLRSLEVNSDQDLHLWTLAWNLAKKAQFFIATSSRI